MDRARGISTKVLGMLKSVFAACVQCSDLLEPSFGVRQGTVDSPMMFCLYVSNVADFICKYGKQSVQLVPGPLEIFSFLFADDMVLLASTPIGLQCQPNNLNRVS